MKDQVLVFGWMAVIAILLVPITMVFRKDLRNHKRSRRSWLRRKLGLSQKRSVEAFRMPAADDISASRSFPHENIVAKADAEVEAKADSPVDEAEWKARA